MAGVKRSQNTADPALVAKAKALRLQGATMRVCAQETGLSRATLGNYFKDDPDLATDKCETLLANEEAELVERLADLTDDFVTIVKGTAVEYSRRLNGEKPKKGIGARDLKVFLQVIESTRKLVQVTRGRPTAITKTITEKAEAEPPRTDQEAKALEALKRRTGGMVG